MILNWYQNLPLHIDPIAFAVGSFSVRWYGLMYLVGFAVVYLILLWRIKYDNLEKIFQDSNMVFDYLLLAFFSALIGGRLGYVLLYDTAYFFADPLAIISPFDQSGNLTGFYGMSYHGALAAIVFSSWIFLKKKKIDFLAWADFVIPAAALGYFFGRIGNFLNGELFGRLTSSPIGMHFAADAANLRHPSQLYEAFLEGILLFVVLWKIRNHKFEKGFLFGIYLLGYGLLRIVAEQFREPDPQLGFLWNYFTLGQILSSTMVVFGLLLIILKKGK
jgi:phosphatidylglycerol:prolipoprotein diacylglycerol transferase